MLTAKEYGIYLAVALLVVLILSQIDRGQSASSPAIPAALSGVLTSSDAMSACGDAVSNRLYAPSTARFSDFANDTAGSVGDIWTVQLYVDSQNGFGAIARGYYTCKLRFSDNTGLHWANLEASPFEVAKYD